jgi:hypothetical protein
LRSFGPHFALSEQVVEPLSAGEHNRGSRPKRVVKDVQAQMRHSRSSTTLDIYQQFVPESQQPPVDELSSLSKRIQ